MAGVRYQYFSWLSEFILRCANLQEIFFYNIAAELKIRDTLKEIYTTSLDKIEEAFTANNLCRCKNPVTTAFEVSLYQHQSSYINAYKLFGSEDILRAKNHGETLKFE